MCIKYLALGRGSIDSYYFFVSLSSNIPEELFIVPVTVKGIVFPRAPASFNSPNYIRALKGNI